jgi:hypothetical protein
MRRGWLGWTVALGCVGCVGSLKPELEDGGQEGPQDPTSTTGGLDPEDTDDVEDPSASESPSVESSGRDEASDEADEDGETTDGCAFIDCDDPTETCGGSGVACECDVWAQDCPVGEKCAPWANDGGSSWNATRCVSIDDNPGEPGDPCQAEGSGVTGLDDCNASSMCWDVDETGLGTCVAFCSGNEASPVCESTEASCVIANDGVLILCLPNCDPLMSDCGDGSACYPTETAFVCVFDASLEEGAYADACEYTNVCDPGLWCAPAETVPGCETPRCCTPFCDLSEPDPDGSCPGAAGGQECVPWYEEGQVPPGYEDIGTCAIPL